MELSALRAFRALARHEHVGRAAAELYVTQPALSRTLARLERDLGVPLFDRHGRRIRLNAAGAVLLRRADRAIAELDDARREIADATGLEHGTVSVAAETLLPLAGPLQRFLAEHPGVDVRLLQATPNGMLEYLARGDVDLCVASQPVEGPGVQSVELLDEEVFLAVPHGHRLARRAVVTVEEIADERFVTTRAGHWQRELTDRLFAEAGLLAHVACEGDEPAATQYLIGAGLGVGLLPAVARRADEAAGGAVAWLRLDAPGCRRVLRAAWREHAYLSAATVRFRDGLGAHLEATPA